MGRALARPARSLYHPAYMRLTPLRIVLLPIFALIAAPACKPEETPLRTELFSESCAQLFSCGCAEYGFADAAQCETVYAVQFAGLEASAEAAGLTVDLACLQQQDIYLELACKKQSDFPEGPLEEEECNYCNPVHGTVAVGQPCIDYGDINDCSQGLFCLDNVCVDPCAKAKLGESCRDFFGACEDALFCDSPSGLCAQPAGLGQGCEEAPCAEGLKCMFGGFDDPPLCKAPAGPGQPCPGGNECTEGLVCNFDTTTCEPPAGAGESCDFSDCMDGLYCSYDPDTGTGTCGPPPKVGEPCQGVCEEGAYCPFDNPVCVALPGAGQPCLEYGCAKGFECDQKADACIDEQPLICDYYY